jgi:uncharacterized protein (TIGR03083 family)
MTNGAVDALRAEGEVLVEIATGFGDADWEAESGCAGWSVHDVVAHLGALYWLVVDPSQLPDTADLPTEQAQDRNVEARRSWSAERVLDDYVTVTAQALELLGGFETQDFELPLGDLGTYPAALLPNAFAFDHYTHIRADLFEPRGPLSGPTPPDDELRLVPALDWVAAALPQQNERAIGSLDGSVELHVVGPAARSISIGAGPVVGEITSEAPAFIRWITQRAGWDDLVVTATGAEPALDVTRSLHVF